MMVVTDQDKDKVKQYLKEAVKATERVQEEQAHIRDILNTLKADHDIPTAISRKIIGAMRKGQDLEVCDGCEVVVDDVVRALGAVQ